MNIYFVILIYCISIDFEIIEFKKNRETIIAGSYPVTFVGNGATLRCEMYINAGYKVDFAYENSFYELLGFLPKEYTEGVMISENFVDIMKVDTILVNCDLTSNSFSNGKNSNSVYSFFPSVRPGSKIVEKATHLVFLPVNRKLISTLTFWLSDQYYNPINFRNVNITLRFYLRKSTNK